MGNGGQGFPIAEAHMKDVRFHLTYPGGAELIAPLTKHSIVCSSHEVAERASVVLQACEGIATEKLAGKSIAEYVAGEAFLQGLSQGQEGATVGFAGIGVELYAAMVAGQFKGSGAVNYLVMQAAHPSIGPFTITIQRQDAKTPADGLLAARREIQALKDKVESLVIASRRILQDIDVECLASDDGDGVSVMLVENLRQVLTTWPDQTEDLPEQAHAGN